MTFLPEEYMPSNLAIGSRNLALAWRPEDAVEFNNLIRARETREMFVRNLSFLIAMKGFDKPESFATSIGLSEVIVARALTGVTSYHYAAYMAGCCGVDLNRMFHDELSKDHFLQKQALRVKTA